MIQLSQDHIPQVEYLLKQAQLGNHILFAPEWIREAFCTNSPFTAEEAYEIEPIVEKLLTLSTYDEKRFFLDEMDGHLRTKVVRTYFNIVENNIVENEVIKH